MVVGGFSPSQNPAYRPSARESPRIIGIKAGKCPRGLNRYNFNEIRSVSAKPRIEADVVFCCTR